MLTNMSIKKPQHTHDQHKLFHLLFPFSFTTHLSCNFTFELDLSILDLHEEYTFNNSLKLQGFSIAHLMIPTQSS